MKAIMLFLCSLVFSQYIALADTCFIAKEGDHVIALQGNCDKRHAPASTFKIALSLMGFDSGLLSDAHNPTWPFKEGYVDWLEVWRQDQTPQSWVKVSCVWFSQVLTVRLGMEKFQEYVTKFNYGNQGSWE